MDIHHINTGCGECAYIIFPDGTTMMVDAGENKADNPRHVAPRPNDSRTPGEWIVDYINDMAPNKQRGLDYALITHFHSDHFGGVLKQKNASGRYYNTGMITVAENLRIGKLVDRGYPHYDFLVDKDDKIVKNYFNFLHFTKRKFGMEQFRPGYDNQFKLLHDSASYAKEFKVQNIYSNGNLWTGRGHTTRYLFPDISTLDKADVPKENTLSCALKITYGDFSYYTGGDVTGYPKPGRSAFHDVETPMAPIVGQTEVCCVNHHGYNNATNDTFIATLMPRVFVIQASDALHPNHSTLERMLSKQLYPGKRDVFSTNLHPAAAIVIGDDVKKMKSTQGHIVVRVSPQGKEYYIYILDDSNTKRRIKQIFGPYTCRTAAPRKEVLVASHRGDWRNFADNSAEGIEGCIRMGVDIVEIDLSKTKDGELVLMHDKTVDRTTNGKGKVADLTLAEIKALRLKNGLGRVSDFQVPTLREAMLVAKGRITVNLDKSDKYFDDVYRILKETGTLEQVIIKSDKPYEELRATYGSDLDQMTFMPVVHLTEQTTPEELDKVLDRHFPYYEIVFEKENKPLLLHIKSRLAGSQSLIWINSLWASLCGGYNDDKALTHPNETWGYLVNELGAGILQTDRPELMLKYLKQKHLHD
jgi:beta-lactamase superfamily II metal-dependent hydrolase